MINNLADLSKGQGSGEVVGCGDGCIGIELLAAEDVKV